MTTFAHFTAYIWVAVSNSIDAPVHGIFGRQFELGAGYWDYGPGSGWVVLLMATVLQVVGSVVLMAKGFSIDRKEADMEPPTVGDGPFVD
ncbi:MAG: hypothetical protein ABIE25_09930 [Thermoplasmatota archaeon]|nr:hypothetical protein [Candidatus Thermoplasmatota archaeon]MBU1914692.1 hypothetical protein [Candidatus Thermoplasmatota archaeon]